MDARTNLRVFAIIGIAGERSADADPSSVVTVKKIVYTREAAEAAVSKANAAGDGKTYFWQLTSIEPLG